MASYKAALKTKMAKRPKVKMPGSMMKAVGAKVKDADKDGM
jgi:hypothetical protein